MNDKQKFYFNFKDQVVMVTGSGGWLGAGIAKSFSQAGAKLVLHGLKRSKRIHELEESIRDSGGQTMFIAGDLTNSSVVETIFDQIYDCFGFIDILINNAGIYPMSQILDMKEQEWDDVITINMKSVFLCTKFFAKKLRDKDMTGSIVNIDSIESLDSTRAHSHYDAAKAGIVMFTKVAALELGKLGIRVNSVGPGLINSPNLATWPEGKKRWMDRVPMGRLCEREDIANACMFLSSEAANFISGAHLIVDGGMLTNERY